MSHELCKWKVTPLSPGVTQAITTWLGRCLLLAFVSRSAGLALVSAQQKLLGPAFEDGNTPPPSPPTHTPAGELQTPPIRTLLH